MRFIRPLRSVIWKNNFNENSFSLRFKHSKLRTLFSDWIFLTICPKNSLLRTYALVKYNYLTDINTKIGFREFNILVCVKASFSLNLLYKSQFYILSFFFIVQRAHFRIVWSKFTSQEKLSSS